MKTIDNQQLKPGDYVLYARRSELCFGQVHYNSAQLIRLPELDTWAPYSETQLFKVRPSDLPPEIIQAALKSQL